MIYFWIALGSAIGGAGRYWCNNLVSGAFGNAFPWGTIAVNVAGSFLIGFLASIDPFSGRSWLPGLEARAFLIVGVCGGYTTFSAFSLQTLDLLRTGQWPQVLGNIALSVVLCLLAVWLGDTLPMSSSAPPGPVELKTGPGSEFEPAMVSAL